LTCRLSVHGRIIIIPRKLNKSGQTLRLALPPTARTTRSPFPPCRAAPAHRLRSQHGTKAAQRRALRGRRGCSAVPRGSMDTQVPAQGRLHPEPVPPLRQTQTATGAFHREQNHRMVGTSVGHPVQPSAKAGSPTVDCRGPCPGRA